MLGGCAEEWQISRKTTNKLVTTEHLTSGSLGDVSWVQKAALQLYRRNVPLLHMPTQRPRMSLHVISFARLSPMIVQQVTNAGVRRSGYEATLQLYPLQLLLPNCGHFTCCCSSNVSASAVAP